MPPRRECQRDPAMPRAEKGRAAMGGAAAVDREGWAAVGKHRPRGDAAPTPRMEGAGCGCCPPCPAWAPASCRHPGPIARLLRGCISRGLSVLPQQEGGGRLPVLTRAGLAGGPLQSPSCSWGAAEALGCWRGSGWCPGSSSCRLGSLGAQHGERWPVPLCVCVHIPCSQGVVVPLPGTHLPAWGHL